MAAAAKQATVRIGSRDYPPEQIMSDLREAMARASRTVEDKPRVETELGPMRCQPWRIAEVDMDLVYVEAGRFDRKRLQAGSRAKPEVADRAPAQIRNGFWIGKNEVTSANTTP